MLSKRAIKLCGLGILSLVLMANGMNEGGEEYALCCPWIAIALAVAVYLYYNGKEE